MRSHYQRLQLRRLQLQILKRFLCCRPALSDSLDSCGTPGAAFGSPSTTSKLNRVEAPPARDGLRPGPRGRVWSPSYLGLTAQ